MSDIIEKINEMLSNSEELQKKYTDELKRISETNEAATPDEAVVIAVKNVLDIDLNLSELEKLRAQQETLDSEELKSISGGEEEESRERYDWCRSNYACHYVYYHPDDPRPGEACFNNWTCAFTWNCVKGPN